MDQEQRIIFETNEITQKFNDLSTSQRSSITWTTISEEGESQNVNFFQILKYKEIIQILTPKVLKQLSKLQPLSTSNGNINIHNIEDDYIFIGQLVDKVKIGYGYLIWKDHGHFLEGNWENGYLQGYCRMIYSNGDLFECFFHQGKTNGFGIYQSKNKIVKGLWLNNLIQGEGCEIKANGTKYYGYYKDGKKQGKCLIYFNDGRKYEGDIADNKLNGFGIMYWIDNSYYHGQFKDGQINGNGSYINGQICLKGQFREVGNVGRCMQRIFCIDQQLQQYWIDKILMK